MASWVTPSVAAEMWNTPVADLLARVDRGELRTIKHGEFMFVDIDPSSPALDAKPSTYAMVTAEEERALLEPIDYATARPVVAATRRRPIAA